MIEHSTVTLPHGITLACRSSGERGRSVLLFLHGFPEAAFVWDEWLTHFSQPEHGGYRCVAPNLRGYAGSSAPPAVKDYRAKHLVQDVLALIALEAGDAPLAALVAHDWGGALAWNLAALHPQAMERLAIINSPHPGTFLRELQQSAEQQRASAYMNFLCRPDAAALLAEDDFRRLWPFFTNMGAADGPHAWLTEAVKDHYRAVWCQGLDGALNYYRASPLRPATASDRGALAVTLPRQMLEVHVPTHVLWAMDDTALPPGLLDGLDGYVPDLHLTRLASATHWVVHEQPQRVMAWLAEALRTN